MGRQPACSGEKENFVVEFAFLFKRSLELREGNRSQINRYTHCEVPGLEWQDLKSESGVVVHTGDRWFIAGSGAG